MSAERMNDRDLREFVVYMVKIAQEAERYEDAVDWMSEVAEFPVEFSPEERNLISAAYKNVILGLRNSWQIISSLEKKEVSQGNHARIGLIKEYRIQIEKELTEYCTSILKLLDIYLIPNSTNPESEIFFNKMKGDYFRYLAEFGFGDERKEAAEHSLVSYKLASDMAENFLSPTDPIRLSIALNFSVFNYKILNSVDEAIKLALDAFENAMNELLMLDSQEIFNDTDLLMKLLWDNLAIWSLDEFENPILIDPKEGQEETEADIQTTTIVA